MRGRGRGRGWVILVRCVVSAELHMARRASAHMRIDTFRYFRILVYVFIASREAAHITVNMRSGGMISVAMAVMRVRSSDAIQVSCTKSWLRVTVVIKILYLCGFILNQTYLGS